ncbi:hypothetical protein [Nocardioides sp. Iso805N]|uniref:hypothetical protein n=1 Tax=Nocardioides sp. Iso805N TaxID=1283287 RepID=UPI000363AC7A|nr:hypothetical protein [Nocardioides sp. Iso805N]
MTGPAPAPDELPPERTDDETAPAAVVAVLMPLVLAFDTVRALVLTLRRAIVAGGSRVLRPLARSLVAVRRRLGLALRRIAHALGGTGRWVGRWMAHGLATTWRWLSSAYRLVAEAWWFVVDQLVVAVTAVGRVIAAMLRRPARLLGQVVRATLAAALAAFRVVCRFAAAAGRALRLIGPGLLNLIRLLTHIVARLVVRPVGLGLTMIWRLLLIPLRGIARLLRAAGRAVAGAITGLGRHLALLARLGAVILARLARAIGRLLSLLLGWIPAALAAAGLLLGTIVAAVASVLARSIRVARRALKRLLWPPVRWFLTGVRALIRLLTQLLRGLRRIVLWPARRIAQVVRTAGGFARRAVSGAVDHVIMPMRRARRSAASRIRNVRDSLRVRR